MTLTTTSTSSTKPTNNTLLIDQLLKQPLQSNQYLNKIKNQLEQQRTTSLSTRPVHTIISPKDLFKSPSQQRKLSTTTSYRTDLNNTKSLVQTARTVYEQKIKHLNDVKQPPLQIGNQNNKWSKWSTSGNYESNDNLMQEAQRRLSYNCNTQTNQKIQQTTEKQKFLNRTSNCYENTRITKYGPDDYDLDELDINVADLNYEDDDIFGDDDDESKQKNNKYITNNQIKTKTSSQSSASTSTSSISACSSSAKSNKKQRVKDVPIVTQPTATYSCQSVKKFKYPINPAETMFMVKKKNQLTSDVSSIVVTNKTEFKFLQPSSSSSYSSSSSPSPSSLSQPPSPQQQIMSPPPPPPAAITETLSIMATLANFSHFDLQSVLFNYETLKHIKDTLHKSINTRTGASAASRQSSFENLNKTLPATQSGNLLLGKDYLIANQDLVDKQRKKSSSETPNTNKRLSSSLFVYLDEESKRLSDCSATKFNELVEECAPFFKLELGGDTFKGLGLVEEVSQRRMMKLNSISCLDKICLNYKRDIIDLIESNNNEPFTIEYQDYGAYYYRYYFNNLDHANYVGVDDKIGPVAVSIRRDKLFMAQQSNRSNNTINPMLISNVNSDTPFEYAYRFILRTSGLNMLRGTILEDNIYSKNSASSIGTKHGLAHKEIIGYLLPELDLSCLRLADCKLNEKLMKLDEQCIIKTHKIGVLLCKAGQSTEEEMYNNKDSTPAFDEFLQLLGERVALKGFTQYRGVLDTTNDTTGSHSVYTRFRDKEIMFHVSTLLPHSNNDKQQLTRKRHIGNDLVTIIFQEPGSLPFSPRTIRSHFQHIFIVVRAYNPNTVHTQYSVAISYSKDVPSFGPPLPKNPLFYKSKEFRDFLLAKIVNADNAGLKCDKFTQIRMRAQHGILKEFSQLYSTKLTLDNCGFNGNNNSVMSKFGLFNFGSIKLKKTRSKSVHSYNNSITNSGDDYLFHLNGAIFWTLEFIQDSQYSFFNSCFFGISKQYVIAIDTKRKTVILSIGCNAVIGWTINELERSVILYYDQGEYVSIRFKTRSDMYQCIKRLEYFTKGCRTVELSLEKKDYGQLGFSIHHDGVVTEVEPYSLAYYRGLKQGTRIVKIGDYFVINMNHEKMIDILRKSACLKVVFLAPYDDGTARRGQDDSYSLYAYLSTCSSLNERLIDSFRTTTPNQQQQTYNYFDTQQYKPHLIQPDSPNTQTRRFSNFSNPKKTAQNRLSSTSATIYNYNINSTNNNIHSNASAYSNSYYSTGCCEQKGKLKEESVILSPTTKLRDKLPDKSNGSTSSTSSNCRIKTQNTNLEWANLVKTASKAFENAHKSSENSCSSAELIHKPTISSNYLSTTEIIDSNDFKKYCLLNKEKTISIDELKDSFIQLQLELNQEKMEKKLTTSKIADILEENMTLKQQLMRLKDENQLLKHQSKPVLKHSDI